MHYKWLYTQQFSVGSKNVHFCLQTATTGKRTKNSFDWLAEEELVLKQRGQRTPDSREIRQDTVRCQNIIDNGIRSRTGMNKWRGEDNWKE